MKLFSTLPYFDSLDCAFQDYLYLGHTQCKRKKKMVHSLPHQSPRVPIATRLLILLKLFRCCDITDGQKPVLYMQKKKKKRNKGDYSRECREQIFVGNFEISGDPQTNDIVQCKWKIYYLQMDLEFVQISAGMFALQRTQCVYMLL